MTSERFIVHGILLTSGKEPKYGGAILVEGNRIKEIGSFKVLRDKYPNLPVVGKERSIVIPGFVNTHSHAVQTLFRGAADDLELLDWLNNVILPGEATISPEELYASCRIGYAEMLMSGITTTNDMLTVKHATHGLQAAVDSGIRGKVGKMLMDRNAPEPLVESLDTIKEEVESLALKYPKGGRIEFSLTPRFIITCSNELMKFATDFAKKHNLLFHTHVAENREECKFVKELTGKSYFHAMDSFGSMHSGSIFAHCVWPEDNEFSLIEKSRINISHNPSSNGKLSSGFAPIPKYLDMGLNVGLATDGSPATGGHDMFLEMKLAAFYQKAIHNDPKLLCAETVFDMATRLGATALGYKDLGELKEGFLADIVILDTESPNGYPMYSPLSFVVYTATKREVSHVIVDGKVLVKEGKLTYNIDNWKRVAERYVTERPFENRIG